jgi:D-sedoheptulose 7-phosphate isomerase
MNHIIESYHQNFIRLLGSISVTDEKGANRDMHDGIADACKIIMKQANNGGTVFFIGNGGSAAIASHMSTDFWKNGKMPSQAFNDSSLLTCISNDFGYEHVFEKPIEVFMKPGDVLVAISSSGCSENILRGVEAARKKGCAILTFSGFGEDNPLRAAGMVNFYVPSRVYGHVEVIHQYLCHWILDSIMDARK